MEITQARVRKLFDYRDDGVLIWKVAQSNRAAAGSVAGSRNKAGYIRIRIDKLRYSAHRLVFLFHHGIMPQAIDHIDGNPSNNRVENLRAATLTQNQGNRVSRRKNGLPKGVDWKPRVGKYQARITMNGRQVFLGLYSSPDDAHAAYLKAAQEYFGEFHRAA